MYNTDENFKELLDYNDDEALYNLKGNMIYEDRTILYINIRVLRYVKNILDFDVSYLNITPIIEISNENVLHHGKRFILPYLTNQQNTITRFGSLYFSKYISGLTNFEQVGGGQAELQAYNDAQTAANVSLQQSRAILLQCNADIAAYRAFVAADPK